MHCHPKTFADHPYDLNLSLNYSTEDNTHVHELHCFFFFFSFCFSQFIHRRGHIFTSTQIYSTKSWRTWEAADKTEYLLRIKLWHKRLKMRNWRKNVQYFTYYFISSSITFLFFLLRITILLLFHIIPIVKQKTRKRKKTKMKKYEHFVLVFRRQFFTLLFSRLRTCGHG